MAKFISDLNKGQRVISGMSGSSPAIGIAEGTSGLVRTYSMEHQSVGLPMLYACCGYVLIFGSIGRYI
jgi:hypothetical protein